MIRNILEIFQKEKVFYWTGIAGILLGLIGIPFMLIQGNAIPPEGEWSKAISFNLAIGVFSLSLAALLPYLSLEKKQKDRFTYPLIINLWIGYTVETLQNVRGLDPRFTEAGTIMDQIMGLLLGLVALVISISIVYLTILVFKQRNKEKALMHLSLRYACIAMILGTLSGVWMSVIQGRVTADAVDIMILHFVGFHGLQSVPIIAWLLEKKNGASKKATKVIHIAGNAWLLLCTLLFIQTMSGYSVYQPTVILILAALTFVVWGVLFLYSLKEFWINRKAGNHV